MYICKDKCTYGETTFLNIKILAHKKINAINEICVIMQKKE